MVYLSAWMYDSVDQGTWGISVNTAQARNAFAWNASNANGDGVSYKAYMLAGTYTCKILGIMQEARAIMKVKIDGSTVATWDQNNGGALDFNIVNTTTGITVASSGLKTIQVVVDGGTGTEWYITFSEIVFYRTD